MPKRQVRRIVETITESRSDDDEIRLTLDWRSCKRPDYDNGRAGEEGGEKRYDDASEIEELILLEEEASFSQSTSASLVELKIAHFPFPNRLPITNNNNLFRSLKSLSLSNCNELERLPASLGHIIAFESISISGCHKLRELPSEISNLRNLKRLTLEFCSSFEIFPIEIGQACKRLEYLGLTGLFNLKNVVTSSPPTAKNEIEPSTFPIFDSLITLVMCKCPLIESLPSTKQKGLFAKNLESLYLKDLHSIRELPCLLEAWKNLKSLKISGCPHLETLSIGGGIVDNGKSNCLETIEISHCKKLQSLQAMTHQEVTTLSSSPLPELKFLALSSCANFSSLPEEIGYCYRLETFKLFLCPKIITIPSTFPEKRSTSSSTPKSSLRELCLEPFPKDALVRFICREDRPCMGLTTLSIAGCHLGNAFTAQILKSLPSTLVKLNLGDNDIDRLGGFFEVEDNISFLGCAGSRCLLPYGLQYLNLRHNPILNSHDPKQQHLCKKVIQQTPRLKFLGMDTDSLRSQNRLVTGQAAFWLYWNAAGRILLSAPSKATSFSQTSQANSSTTKPIPLSLWATVLARVQEIVLLSDVSEEYEASIIYLLLHCPDLFY